MRDGGGVWQRFFPRQGQGRAPTHQAAINCAKRESSKASRPEQQLVVAGVFYPRAQWSQALSVQCVGLCAARGDVMLLPWCLLRLTSSGTLYLMVQSDTNQTASALERLLRVSFQA